MHTGVAGALIDLHRAVFTGVPGWAGAHEVVHGVVAGAPVGAGVIPALIHVNFTMGAVEPGQAVALVVTDKVDTGAPVLAGVDGAVVDVVLAVGPGEAGGADALVLILMHGVHEAGTPVFAGGVHAAVVHLDVTVDPGEPGLAPTFIPSRGVHTVRVIFTGSVATGLGLKLAMVTVVPEGAHAGVVIDPGTLAGTPVDAEVVGALVGDAGLAVGAGPAGWAGARVGALAGVEAGGPVLAGLVVGAVVEVLVAEQAAPALLAVAGPGLIAGTVLAPGVPHALVAEGTSPPISTPKIKDKCISKDEFSQKNSKI